MSHCGGFVQNVSNRLVSSLFSQKESGKYCDIVLRFGEVELKAHVCVVASFSPWVDNLVSSGEVIPAAAGAAGRSNNPSSGCIVLTNKPKFSCLICLNKVIDFMYLGKIQIEDNHLEHIKAVSKVLQVSELLKICQKHSDKSCSRRKTDLESLDRFIKPVTSSCPAATEDRYKTPNPSQVSTVSQPQSTSTEGGEQTRKSDVHDKLRASDLDDDVMNEDDSEWGGIKCPKCDSVFMSLAKYQQHCSSHLGKTYTSCYVCNYASIKVSDVIRHLQEKSHGEKVCSVCLLEVNSSQSLKEHIQIHDQPQPFLCLTCNTRFQTRTALNSHIVRHLNETPFVCKECGRGFKWKHGLRSHMVTHSKLKAFLCDQCGYSTAHLRSFIDHKTVHSGEKFKCPKPDCQFSSVRKESVKHHLKTHSKQRPFQCEICGQAFSQCKNLRRHAASHNPLADIEKCPLCSYQTNRSDKFKAHFKRYHKNGEKIENSQRKRRKLSVSSCTPPKEPAAKDDTSNQLSVTSSRKLDEGGSRSMPLIKVKEVSAVKSLKSTLVEQDIASQAVHQVDIRLENDPAGGSEECFVPNGSEEFISIIDSSCPTIPDDSEHEGSRQSAGVVAFTAPSTSVETIHNSESSEPLRVCEVSRRKRNGLSRCSENVVLIPEQQSGVNAGIHSDAASEQIIVLDSKDSFLSSTDTIYVIPDGPFMIMDAD